jgi:hypothetical protein
MQFKKNVDPISSDDPYYDLFQGGYIKPELLLKNQEEVEKVKEAIATVKTFIDEATEKGLIEEQ